MNKLEIYSFGEYLYHLRTSHNYTLLDLSNLTGIDTSLISKLEKNKRKPSSIILFKLSNHFKIPLKKLKEKVLSDEIAYSIIEQELDDSTLKVAERKIEYLKTKKK